MSQLVMRFWTHSTTEVDHWFAGKGINDEYALVYPGALPVPSVRWEAVRDGLAGRGHTIADWPEFVWRAGAVCVLRADRTSGVISAGADPRRSSYAVGW